MRPRRLPLPLGGTSSSWKLIWVTAGYLGRSSLIATVCFVSGSGFTESSEWGERDTQLTRQAIFKNVIIVNVCKR